MKKEKKLLHIIIKLFLKVILSTLLCSNIYAGILNIVTPTESSVIKVNKKEIGKGVITNYEIKNGSYLIEVEDEGAIIYSKLEQIGNNIKTINVTHPKSLVINRLKDSRANSKYIFSQKSRFGAGFHVDYSGANAGLSLAYKFWGLEHQLIGFVYETSEIKRNNYTYRLVMHFPGQVKKNTYFRTYTGLGFGQSNIVDSKYSTKREIAELILGVQFGFLNSPKYFTISPLDAALGLFCPPILVAKKVSQFLGNDDNLLFHIETGYTYRQTDTNNPNTWQDYKGLKLSAGATYKF